MQHVTGIGGLFFRAMNPTATAEWYRQHLGIALVPADYSQKPWSQEFEVVVERAKQAAVLVLVY